MHAINSHHILYIRGDSKKKQARAHTRIISDGIQHKDIIIYLVIPQILPHHYYILLSRAHAPFFTLNSQSNINIS